MIAPLTIPEQRRVAVRAHSLLWGAASLLPDDEQLSEQEIERLLFYIWMYTTDREATAHG